MTNPNRHAARLDAARRRFFAKTEGLKPDLLRLRLTAMVNKPIGTGEGEIDPLEYSLAKQTLEAIGFKSRIEGAQAELADLNRKPRDMRVPGRPNYQGELAARREELQRDIDHSVVGLRLLSEQDHRRAAAEAVAMYDKADAERERRLAIVQAAEAKIAAAGPDSTAVDFVAASRASRR